MLTKTTTFSEINVMSRAKKLDNDELTEYQAMEVFVSWYKYARFAFLAIVGTTIGGCTYSVYLLNVMFAVKFPDYYLATYGKLVYRNSCPTGFTYYNNYYIYITFGMMVIIACGMGTSNKHFILEQIRKQAVEKNECKNEDDAKADNIYKSICDNRVYPTEV